MQQKRKKGTMENRNSIYMTRRIGNTTYRVRAFFDDEAEETMEDKILRLVRIDGLASDGEAGIMEVPQMSRQSERSA